jgi:glutamate synthase (NADPH/NADH) small chain
MFNVQPVKLEALGSSTALVLEYTATNGTRLTGTGETVRIAADQIFSAIGQTLATDGGLALDGRKISVTGAGRTSRDRVWAGGDCASGGDDLTVTAVAEGRDAAMDIYATLIGGAN